MSATAAQNSDTHESEHSETTDDPFHDFEFADETKEEADALKRLHSQRFQRRREPALKKTPAYPSPLLTAADERELSERGRRYGWNAPQTIELCEDLQRSLSIALSDTKGAVASSASTAIRPPEREIEEERRAREEEEENDVALLSSLLSSSVSIAQQPSTSARSSHVRLLQESNRNVPTAEDVNEGQGVSVLPRELLAGTVEPMWHPVAALAYDDWLLLRLPGQERTPETISTAQRLVYHRLAAALLNLHMARLSSRPGDSIVSSDSERAPAEPEAEGRSEIDGEDKGLLLLGLAVAGRCRGCGHGPGGGAANTEDACPLPSAVKRLLAALPQARAVALHKRVALALQATTDAEVVRIGVALGLDAPLASAAALVTPAELHLEGEVGGRGGVQGALQRGSFQALMCRLTLGLRGAWTLLPRHLPTSLRPYHSRERRARLQRCRVLKKVGTSKKLAREAIHAANREVAALMLGTDLAFLGDVLDHGLRQGTLDFAAAAEGYDEALPSAELFQASRNAWTCFALQLLYGSVALNDGVTGYSLLYPYSDNYLDDPKLAPKDKVAFQRRFRRWLAGDGVDRSEAGTGQSVGENALAPANGAERKVWDQVRLIQRRFPLPQHANVAHALVAILDAQTASLRQHTTPGAPSPPIGLIEDVTVYKVNQVADDCHGTFFFSRQELALTAQHFAAPASLLQGGTSVLADAFLAPVESLTLKEQGFAFAFGVALQLVDDIQVGVLPGDWDEKRLVLKTGPISLSV
jgi:hypothetical protein